MKDTTKIENNVHELGLLDTLGIVFLVLKLCGVINWSWWWVLCPFYPTILALAVGILILLGLGIYHLFSR